MPKTLKLTNTLADETRYSIYQYVLKEKKEVTVQEIADQFGIHPNVARLHLTKLNESNLLDSVLLKNGKGGRPARMYTLAKDPVYLSFPKQEDHLLLQWLLELADSFGEEAITKGKQITYRYGEKQMQRFANSVHSFEDKLNAISEVATSIGYITNVHEDGNKKSITFSIYNCPYQDSMNKHSHLVCELHESYLKGQFDVLFPNNEFEQLESMQNQCKNCLYQIEVL